MWATLTTSAMGGLRPRLYPHGASAFAAAQQLAGAAFGAVLISACTIGSGARDAGVLDLAQATSTRHAAFRTAGVIGLLVLVGAFFIRRIPAPAADATVADATSRRGDAGPAVQRHEEA